MTVRPASDTRPAILIVDDVDANLLALEAQLASLDCDIVRARSGNEALGHLLRREFAVLLLDVQMPEMDGYEVARLARQNAATRDIPIVFVTAMHETEESVLQGYGSGAIDFLFKPINAQVLRGKVRVFLELYEGRRRLITEIEAHKRTLGELEAFNYSVSHDLRAPLRPLDGFADVLLEDYGAVLDDKGRDYLRRIQAAARRMGELIDDLLELSRVSRTPVQRQPVELGTMARAIIDELQQGDPARVVDFVVAPTLTAQGDPRLLRIALENLLRNAWKFTRTRPRARIEVGLRESAEPSFFVADDGVGFDPAFASRLFQPFQRLHGVTEFEGTGIGLAIVSRIVGGHGGRIWADASVDGGARFFFTLAPSRIAASR
jgi:two-component system, sensor histidine kinase and response regulator